MKKVYLSLLALLFAVNYSYAQWTTSGSTIYYPLGNVAVGGPALAPYYRFSVAPDDYGDGFFGVNNGRAFLGDVNVDQNGTGLTVDDISGTITAFAGYYNFGGGGNFGINTSGPIANFQVNDGTSKASLGNAGNGNLFGTGYLGFNAARAGLTSWVVSGDGFHNGGGVIYNGISNGEIYFAPIENTGTAGKTLSDADVKSRIQFRITPTATYAKQIYVETTGWPDFVFKKDYALKPLSEIKSYIDQNQHLPDMPAAATIEKDGINLGEMNKALVKKVEELTLYLIQKDNEIKSQQDVNKQQQQINQSQEEKLKKLSDQLETLSRQITAKN